LARALGAEGNAQGAHHATQFGGAGCFGRRNRAAAIRRSRQDVPPREQQTPAALAAQQQAEIEKWWPILKAANIKAENIKAE